MSTRRQPVRLALTPRDYAILHSLSEARYLTIDAIEWLHFPQWRTRWEQWVGQQQTGSDRRYKACTQAYTRVQQLSEAGLVGHIIRPAMLAVNTYRREPDLFFLTEAGAHALADQTGVPLATLHFRAPRERSYALLPHHAAVGRTYAALRCRIAEKPGLQFSGWRSEHDATRDFDRLEIVLPHMDGSRTHVERGIQPDGTFFIEHPNGRSLFFVEVERDQPVAKWREKVWAYEAYHGSAPLKARFDHGTFALLGVVESRARQQALLEATAEALVLLYGDGERRQQAQRRYLITTLHRVHPATVGAGWLKVEQATRVERRGAVPWGVTVQAAEYTLVS